jgi:acetoin utilization protein AcuB
MHLNNIMLERGSLVIVSPKSTVKEALEKIEQHNFLSIPVVDGDKFCGAISKDDIYEYFFKKGGDNKKEFIEDFTVDNVMRTDIPVITPDAEIEDAVHILEVRNIAFVAVADEDNIFKGILTHHAVFEQFTQLFGFNKGVRLAVIANDVPGQISKLSRIITQSHGDIVSFVVVDPKSVIDVREIVMRIKTDDIETITRKVKEAGFKIQ